VCVLISGEINVPIHTPRFPPYTTSESSKWKGFSETKANLLASRFPALSLSKYHQLINNIITTKMKYHAINTNSPNHYLHLNQVLFYSRPFSASKNTLYEQSQDV
jgi:hypothetical protein